MLRQPFAPDDPRQRRADQADADQGDFGINHIAHLPPHKLGQRLDDQPVRLFGTNRQPQRVRKTISANGAQDEAARGEKFVGFLR